MSKFSKKFCAKSPFKFGGVFGNILRIAPKTSTANVTKGSKSKSKNKKKISDYERLTGVSSYS